MAADASAPAALCTVSFAAVRAASAKRWRPEQCSETTLTECTCRGTHCWHIWRGGGGGGGGWGGGRRPEGNI